MPEYPFVDYQKISYSPAETALRAQQHFEYMNARRTVREFSDRPIAREVIERLLLCASTAPSGAHKQPWTFCVVTNQELKSKIRVAAEQEEREFYEERMPAEWLEDLAPIGTDWHKPFLEIAPALIVVFRKSYELLSDGKKRNNYYVSESVGIACGFLLEAIHHAGLVALTHTPSPMNFLSKLLNRPENEKPYLLVPIGYPLDRTQVPDLRRKNIEEIAKFYE